MSTPILNYLPQGGLPAGGVDFPSQRQGYFFYWPQIENLTGGVQTTDLDAQNIAALPADSVIMVIIDGRGESQWLRKLPIGVTLGGPVSTDLNAGIIVPTNYDDTHQWVLYRQLGF